jgi:hypothetical protein
MASGASTHLARSRVQGAVIVPVVFSTDASGVPDPDPTTGFGWSVARTGVGTYRITLKEKYVSLDHCGPNIRTNDGQIDIEYSASSVNASPAYVDVKTYSAGVVYDVPSALIHVLLILNETCTREGP